jgi:hypothetical protein
LGLPSVKGEEANKAVASGWSARPTRNFLRHVRLRLIVEVHLDGAGAQHHVEPQAADAGHVAQHDPVAAFGHDRQLVAALVRPHAEAEEAEAEAIADGLDLVEVTAGLGAGFVQIAQGGAGQFELAGRFEADRAVGAGQGDDVAALLDRAPAIFGQALEQIANAAGLVIARRAVIGEAVDELLVLGADPPSLARLLATHERARAGRRGFRWPDRHEQCLCGSSWWAGQ